MLSDLKNFEATRCNLTELVNLSAYGRILLAEFETLGVQAPEWVEENVKAVRREAKSRNRDSLAASLREKKARLETLKTPDEKRRALSKEIAALEKDLELA